MTDEKDKTKIAMSDCRYRQLSVAGLRREWEFYRMANWFLRKAI